MKESCSQIRRVNIQLGSACNLRCRYCLQQDITHLFISKEISNVAVQFLEEVADKQPRHDRVKRPILVNFTGGEPLLYFKSIQSFVQSVHADNVRWQLVTNGTLVTPGIVSFLNDNDIRLCLSHDGRQTAMTRGTNVLESPDLLALMKDIKQLSIDSVITAYNQDPYELRSYLEQILGKPTRLKLMLLTMTPRMPADLVEYDFEKWESTCEQMSDAALTSLKFGDGQSLEAKFYKNYLKNFLESLQGGFNPAACGIDGGRITIDCQGNILLCASGVSRLCTVLSPIRELSRISFVRFQKEFKRNHLTCLQCEAFPVCRGNCPIHGFGPTSALQCRFMKIFARSVANLAFRMNELEGGLL